MRHAAIALRIEELNEARQVPEELTAEAIRLSVKARLDKLSQNGQPDMVRVRATELLGRLDGVQAFEADRKEVTHKRGIDTKDAEHALRIALERAMASLQQAGDSPKAITQEPSANGAAPVVLDAEYQEVTQSQGEVEGAPYDPGVDL